MQTLKFNLSRDALYVAQCEASHMRHCLVDQAANIDVIFNYWIFFCNLHLKWSVEGFYWK